MSNFKNNPKYPIEPSSNEPFVPYFLRSSREATEPLGGRDYVIFPDSFPLIGMPLTGNEQLMVQGKLEEPEIMTPNQIKEFFQWFSSTGLTRFCNWRPGIQGVTEICSYHEKN